MTTAAIHVDRLSKQFRIGATAAPNRISEVVTAWGRRLFRRTTDADLRSDRQFSALTDLSFEIGQGEVTGVIGRNGAGKSTLLKILAGVTEPTSGRYGLRGRIGSLLEVGTGFHHELTGRENIFLSGTILGMSRGEVLRKLDAIVDFSGVEDFLETPVKRYSSGMVVRLGFAVAAHLEPEILLVDEVLAVGDAEFQNKCIGRMNDVARSGRTVLFVSHSMAAIHQLCTSALLLEEGKLVKQGGVAEVTDEYLSRCSQVAAAEFHVPGDREQLDLIESISVRKADGTLCGHPVSTREPVTVCLQIRTQDGLANKTIRVLLSDQIGNTVLHLDSRDSDVSYRDQTAAGVYNVSTVIPAPLLVSGTYRVTAELARPGLGCLDSQADRVQFQVEDRESRCQSRKGSILHYADWQVRPADVSVE